MASRSTPKPFAVPTTTDATGQFGMRVPPGDYRITGTDPSGAPYAVYFNVNTKQGKAYVNGKPVEGEEADKLVKGAYARYINDTYWLLAPWKVFDPGVTLVEKPNVLRETSGLMVPGASQSRARISYFSLCAYSSRSSRRPCSHSSKPE